jgi:ADP-ribose pyrophosphatase YjhB (NUDIX family)
MPVTTTAGMSPGGAVDAGEPPAAAAVRKARGQINADVRPTRLAGVGLPRRLDELHRTRGMRQLSAFSERRADAHLCNLACGFRVEPAMAEQSTRRSASISAHVTLAAMDGSEIKFRHTDGSPDTAILSLRHHVSLPSSVSLSRPAGSRAWCPASIGRSALASGSLMPLGGPANAGNGYRSLWPGSAARCVTLRVNRVSDALGSFRPA